MVEATRSKRIDGGDHDTSSDVETWDAMNACTTNIEAERFEMSTKGVLLHCYQSCIGGGGGDEDGDSCYCSCSDDEPVAVGLE